jgi:hypothetical protein
VVFILYRAIKKVKESTSIPRTHDQVLPYKEDVKAPIGISSFQSGEQSGAQITETVRVVHEYVENLFDEMTLNINDRVLVNTRFNDGWAFGLNLDSKQQGF